MKAAVYSTQQELRIEERQMPQINQNEILIKMRACAICGTDMRIMAHGHFKIPDGVKRVLGHEIAGEVFEVGKNVKGFSAGMRVVIPPNVGCGICEMCRQGFNQMCPDYEAFGISMDGGFQEYIHIPSHALGNVITIPENLSYEEAALIEPLSCCFNSFKKLGTKPGDIVLVIGAGPVGSMHLLLSKLVGSTVFVADIVSDRLVSMKKLGADLTINSAEKDLKEVLRKETGGRGADVVITACSVPELQAQALEMAAIRGRISFFGGLPKEKEEVCLNTNLIHYKELVVLGTTGSSMCDYYQSLQLVASKKIDLKPLVGKIFNIDEINKAIIHAKKAMDMKVLVVNRD